MERKGHAPEAIEAAVARLRSLGLLDDLAFARAYIAARAARGRGPVRLRYDLNMLGVPRDLADTALSELMAGVEDPLDQPRALAAKRAKQLTGLSREAKHRRLIAFLGRRGHRGSDAHRIVEGVLKV